MLFGFNSAVRGLLASQRALYTTNHNIDNANTKGYSRQQVAQGASDPFKMPGVGFIGTGSGIKDINRVRDSFVDFKYWNETAPMGEWQVKADKLTEIEKLMAEPSDNSFRQYLDDFYGSLDEMSKNPSDLSFREPVRQNALAFTKHINETGKRLADMKKETEYTIEIKVKSLNSLGREVASLNRQIYSAELSGREANDLRDKRELLVDDISNLANIRANETDDGKFSISIGGINLVDHLNANSINFDKDATMGEMLSWENGGNADIKSGELKGLIDIYGGDGEDNKYRGIPYYITQLNKFASGFADKFNEVHRKGYGRDSDLPGDKDKGIGNFFTYDDRNPSTTISLHKDIMDDVKNIRAASESGGEAEDNGNLLELIDGRESKTFFEGGVSQGTPDDFIKSILSSMSVDSLQAGRISETQGLIRKNLETKRNSISGVSLDEEMADMVKYQHVYVAASKMISTMDNILNITINQLGRVGR